MNPGMIFGLIIVSLIVFVPLLGIWAINTLFGTMIPFNFSTWFAMLILLVLFRDEPSRSK